MLRGDGDPVGHKVGGVKTNAELTDHRGVGSGLESLHEGLSTGFSDGTKVVDEINLRHADTSIDQ